jgi:hypothetical protein
MRILEQAIAAREAASEVADAAFLRTVSPVAWHHINFGGRITFYDDLPPAPIAASVAAVLAYRRSATEHSEPTAGGHDAGNHQEDDAVDED